MASSKSPAKHNVPGIHRDLISNLPTVVIDNILKLLPLQIAARTSVLSTKWRQNWLSHRYLVFDEEFWEGQRTNGCISWQTISNIINTILFHHNGPIHVFHLCIPFDLCIQYSIDEVMHHNLNQWLSYLSKHDIKQMILVNRYHVALQLPWRIFSCKDMVELSIHKCILMPPPSCFEGFARLQSLELSFIKFWNWHDSFRRLLASCPRLSVLKLITHKWNRPDHDLVIDVPSIESLTVEGVFDTLTIKNARRLKSLSLLLYQSRVYFSVAKTADLASLLIANAHELQNLHLGGDLCKLLGECAITEQFSIAFIHLHTLSLANLDMADSRVIRFTVGMIQSCPLVKHLKISFDPKTKVDERQFKYYNDNYKLGHLRNVEIKCTRGSIDELKFIEFILANSVVLENLFFGCCDFGDDSFKVRVLRELLQLPRASTKAKLICQEQ